jgi:hypothetical protein
MRKKGLMLLGNSPDQRSLYVEMRDLRAHQTFHMSPLSIFSRQTVIGFSHRPKE